jgi:hypothetical protein
MSDKLREALKIARRFVYASTQTTGRDLLVNDRCGKPYILTPQYALGEIDAALAKPLRNCDIGTAKEQYERFRDMCFKTNCEALVKYNTLSEYAFEWAQTPYESEVNNG